MNLAAVAVLAFPAVLLVDAVTKGPVRPKPAGG